MIYVHLADGFEEIEAIAILDILRRAELSVSAVSITKDYLVRGAHDITIKADILYEEAEYEVCNLIVLPGGMPGTTNLCAHKGLLSQIRSFAKNDKPVAAICAAPMVLAKAGILEGKKATIYPGMEEHLAGAKLQDSRVVIDGKIITSKGPGTAMEFAVALVEFLKGAEKTADLIKAMVMS